MIEFREATHEDIENITGIYNSNRDFLLHHLGRDCIDENFVREELNQMKAIGFLSEVLLLNHEMVGFIDYRAGEETYLSLLMISGDYQRKGIGRKMYRLFEHKMIRLGSKSIRIDIVNDYETNPMLFWEKLGYREQEAVRLTWGDKTSSAVMMIKSIRMPLQHRKK